MPCCVVTRDMRGRVGGGWMRPAGRAPVVPVGLRCYGTVGFYYSVCLCVCVDGMIQVACRLSLRQWVSSVATCEGEREQEGSARASLFVS